MRLASRHFGESLRAVLGRPGLILTLAIANLALSWLVSVPLSSALAPALDRTPGAWQVLAGNDALAGELLTDHPELVRVAFTTLMLGALVYLVVSWVLAGGLLAAFGLDEPTPAQGARAFSTACGRNAPRMMQAGGASLLLRAVPLGVGLVLYAAFKLLVVDDRGFHYDLAALVVTGLLGGLAWALTTVVIAYVFGLALRRPHDRARALLWGALRLAARAPGRTLALACISGGGWLLLSALQQGLARALPIAPAWGFDLRTLIGVLAELARAALGAAVLVCAAATASDLRSA